MSGLTRSLVLGGGATGVSIAPADLPTAGLPAGTLLRDLATGLIYGQSDGSGGYEPLGGGAAVSDGYVCHFYAPLACDSDTKARDISGALNDGSFQANLSAATAWATAGFLTQPNPSVSGELSLVQFPAVSWDWSAGDCLFIFWMGRGTPEGSDAPMFGDSAGAGLRSGFKLMVTPGGNVKSMVYQNPSTSVYGPVSSAAVVSSSVTHSFAICVVSDGGMCYWSDGVRNAGHVAGYLKPSGAPVSTINAAPVYLGGDGYAPGGVQNGMALQTRALVVLKGRRNNIPTVESMDVLVAALHRNPQALVSADAW